MRQSGPNHSFIPVRANSSDLRNQAKTVDALSYQSKVDSAGAHAISEPTSTSSNSKPIMPLSAQRGLGISSSPSRLPARALEERLKSVFATRMHNLGDASVTQNSNHHSSKERPTSLETGAARAPSPGTKLTESVTSHIIGTKGDPEIPSPSISESNWANFTVRNLDENPHTGLTPTSRSFTPKKDSKRATRFSNAVQHFSPPPSPRPPSESPRSRLPRRSKDDLSLAESSRKLQAASASAQRPRRTSISTPRDLQTIDKPETEMTVPLAPPSPISIPGSDLSIEKSTASTRSPGAAIASLFRWNTAPISETSHDRLQTPTTLSRPVTPMTPPSPSRMALEQELRSVSADLAYSIRREMDLEDVITRLQEEIVRLGGEGKQHMRFRTSDYFSENSYHGSPPLRAVDDSERTRHSRVSSVAAEDIRMANEKVTQLEKEVLALKHENIELTTWKRDAEKKLKDQKINRVDVKKMQALELNVEQLREELIEKSQTIETLKQTIKRQAADRVGPEEIQKLTERAKGAESQREALQLALRQLRERQALEAKVASDRIKQLEAEKERSQRPIIRSPDRAVTGITHRNPSNIKNLEEKIAQLQSELSNSGNEVATLTATNTQLSSENTRLREMQQKLQSRLSQMEAATSALAISEASAAASLSYAHRLALEMARLTDIHVKSLDKVRSTANTSLPHIKNGNALSSMLQSAYDMSLSPAQLTMSHKPSEEATVNMMDRRIEELEGALQESSTEMGEVVRKMQMAQIEMIELAGERDEALRREKTLVNQNKS